MSIVFLRYTTMPFIFNHKLGFVECKKQYMISLMVDQFVHLLDARVRTLITSYRFTITWFLELGLVGMVPGNTHTICPYSPWCKTVV